jgi:hypothetical protein
MKKIEKKAAAALVLAGLLLIGPLAAGKAEAKKYYRSRTNFSVTGDANNADASIVYTGGVSTTTNHYRRVSFSGLRMANPFSYRVFEQMDPSWNFGEDAWSLKDRYFITDGSLWFHYGDSRTYNGSTTYSNYSTGNQRLFNYYGGNVKKNRKNSAYKIYEFSVSGTEGNSDATSKEGSSSTTYYYRKVDVPELQMDNLVDYRLYSRNDFPQGFNDESWMLENDDFFVSNGALYVAYGYKTGSNFYNFSSSGDTFRFFSYSNGKRTKKNRLKKQYVKRYDFSVPNDPSAADRIAISTDNGYTYKEYYKKIRIKGAAMTNFPNIQVMKRNNFSSGFTDESWSERSYAITDGYIWVYYGYESIDPGHSSGTYEDTGSGNYRAFSYR